MSTSSASRLTRIACGFSMIGRPKLRKLRHLNPAANVRFGSKADMTALSRDVRYTPNSRHGLERVGCPLCANSGHCSVRLGCPLSANRDISRCGKYRYSITSSARYSTASGISIPSALAVLWLITSSNLVGCSTGRSDGFAPARSRHGPLFDHLVGAGNRRTHQGNAQR